MDKHNVQGYSHERLYAVYNGMLARCYNKNHPKYKNWGGRGIKVCNSWKNDYQTFRKWAYANGYDKNKDRKYQSLDRINNDGDYCPQNCRWATMKEQANNTRKRVIEKGYKHNWTIDGETRSAREWCKIYKVNIPTVMYRIKTMKMTPKEALVANDSRRKNETKKTFITPQRR